MKFIVMVPVEFTVHNEHQTVELWQWLKDAGTSMFTSDELGVFQFDIRTDKVRLKDVKAAYRSAITDSNGK